MSSSESDSSVANTGNTDCKRKRKTYYFHDDWEHEYFVTMSNDKCICLICRAAIATLKKGNVERHFSTCHSKYKSDYPASSELRKAKIKELKLCLKTQQSFFTKPVLKHEAANIASFRVSKLIAQRKRPFEEGEVMKEAFLEAADSLFATFKNKAEIVAAIKDMPLSRQTVTRRVELMAEDISSQILLDLQNCIYFSVQLDETTDYVGTAQLAVFVRMVFADASIKEDFLTLLSLATTTKGQDIYMSFKDYLVQNNIEIKKLICIATDGAPAMTGQNTGFIGLCSKDPTFPKFVAYHCIIHQQVLCSKVVEISHVMKPVVKAVNSIRAHALQRRLFKQLLDDVEAEHSTLVFHTEVRWLSKGKTLKRFRELLPHIIEFMESKQDNYPEFKDSEWLLDLAFAIDIFTKINELNMELQGQNKDISNLISSVNSFRAKLKLWISHVEKNIWRHFPDISSELQQQKKIVMDASQVEKFSRHLTLLLCEFDKRFESFQELSPIVSIVANPFAVSDVEIAAETIASFLSGEISSVENELLSLQNNVMLRGRASDPMFWRLVSAEEFPLLSDLSKRVSCLFGSTYLCESGFSQLSIIKSKFRSTLTDSHLADCLRLGITQYSTDFKKLSENMELHPSH